MVREIKQFFILDLEDVTVDGTDVLPDTQLEEGFVHLNTWLFFQLCKFGFVHLTTDFMTVLSIGNCQRSVIYQQQYLQRIA